MFSSKLFTAVTKVTFSRAAFISSVHFIRFGSFVIDIIKIELNPSDNLESKTPISLIASLIFNSMFQQLKLLHRRMCESIFSKQYNDFWNLSSILQCYELLHEKNKAGNVYACKFFTAVMYMLIPEQFSIDIGSSYKVCTNSLQIPVKDSQLIFLRAPEEVATENFVAVSIFHVKAILSMIMIFSNFLY